MSKLLSIALLLLVSINCLAGQHKEVKHMQTITVDLSIKDPNIISVKNDRINTISTTKGTAVANIDKDNGILNIKPAAMYYERPFSMILFTEKGNRYTLISNPKSIPAQDIVLENKKILSGKDARIKGNTGYESDIALLVKSMIKDEGLDGYRIEGVVDKKDSDNKDKRLHLINKFIGSNMIGEIILFKNKSDKKLRIKEKEFYGQNVLAISISNTVLNPNEITKVYRVVKHG